MRETPEERFLAKVTPEPNSGCWLWTAGVDRDGYGQFWNGEQRVRAHRFSYQIYKGPIPEGLHIDHLCSVECCVNPDHLEAVTLGENNRRTVARGRNGHSTKTHCPAGHPYAGDNLYVVPYSHHRLCRTCGVLRKRARRKRLAVEAELLLHKEIIVFHPHLIN